MGAPFKKLLLAPLAVLGGVALMGLGIGTTVSMPGYALVMVDDTTHEYFAPQCAAAWRSQSQAFGILRRTNAGEAFKLRYKQNDACNETGAFHPDGYALTPLILSKIGLLPPKKQWWDMPYRTEGGVIYPPDIRPRPQ